MTTITQQPENRWQTIRDIWKQNQWLFGAVGFLLGMLVGPLADLLQTDMAGLLESLVPEAFGIVITVLFIDRLYQNREEQREQGELKSRLIRELGSQAHDVAINASEELRRHGWLQDGSLHGVNLAGANLQGVHLTFANLQNAEMQYTNLQSAVLAEADLQSADMEGARLQGAFLYSANLKDALLVEASLQNTDLLHANLQGADLEDANIQKANLKGSNLKDANLIAANLQGSQLACANLQGADLSYTNLRDARLFDADLQSTSMREWATVLSGRTLQNTNLQGANLYCANLRGADLHNVIFDENTVLPDSDYCDEGPDEFSGKWTPDTDMTRYTNPEHPEFWQPD